MKNRWLIFAVFLLSALIFYHKSLQVYFLSDDWRLFYLLNRYGFSAIALNFESEFIRIIPCVLLSAIYFLFGIASAFPFHLLSILLHTLNAFLVFVLAQKIFNRHLQNGNGFLYSFMAGFIFISLPYQVEAVTWMSGTSDLIASCFVLLSLILYDNFKILSERKHLFLSVLFFLLAVLSKESSLFMPLLILFLEAITERKNLINRVLTVAAYFVPVLVYALLNQFLTGFFITPGVKVFTGISFSLLLENYFLYAAKFFTLYRLLPSEIREILKVMLEYKTVALPVIAAALLAAYFLWRKKLSVKRPQAGVIIFSFVSMIISLIPVIHLETSFVGSSQSDRYGYLPSVFFVILVSGIISIINRKAVAIGVLGLVMVWFYTEVQALNRNWVQASGLAKRVVNRFEPGEGVSYIANIPDNFNGVYVLRNGLSEIVSINRSTDFVERIKVISYHTITSEDDKANAKLISDSVCHVTFAKPQRKIPPSEKIFMLLPDTSSYFYSEVSDTSFTVTVKKLPAKSVFYFYSAGSLNAIH